MTVFTEPSLCASQCSESSAWIKMFNPSTAPRCIHCHVRDERSKALRSYLPKSTWFLNDKDRTDPTHTDLNWLVVTPIHCLLMNFLVSTEELANWKKKKKKKNTKVLLGNAR